MNEVVAFRPAGRAADMSVPIHSIEAEQGLLGAILINNDAFPVARKFVGADDFFEPLHQKIFDVAEKLITVGKLATPVTMMTFLPADLTIAGLSLSQYLARLCAEATTIINASDYAVLIRDMSALREL